MANSAKLNRRLEKQLAASIGPSPVVYRTMRLILRPLIWLIAPHRVVGLENIPRNGTFVIASSHRSNLDPFLVGMSFPSLLAWVGKHTVWKYAPIAWLAARVGAIPNDRGKGGGAAYQSVVQIMRRGIPGVFFAEGHRGSGPTIGPLFPGAARAALELQCVILPVGIGGAERILAPGAKFPKRGRVVVVIGRPIVPWEQLYYFLPEKEVNLIKHLRRDLQDVFDQAQAFTAR